MPISTPAGGTFSIPMARLDADVVAVEVAGSSIRDLRRNAEVNNVELEAICGDTAVELPELGELDALVVDPPRSGSRKGGRGPNRRRRPRAWRT